MRVPRLSKGRLSSLCSRLLARLPRYGDILLACLLACTSPLPPSHVLATRQCQQQQQKLWSNPSFPVIARLRPQL